MMEIIASAQNNAILDQLDESLQEGPLSSAADVAKLLAVYKRTKTLARKPDTL